MQGTFSIISILYLIGAAQGAFLALALFSHRGGNRTANRYLGWLTLVFVLALLDYFLDITGLVEHYAWLRTLLWPKEFLYGILIYFYVRELTLPGQFPLSGRQWLHFIPALLHVLVTWPLLLFSSDVQLMVLSRNPPTGVYVYWELLLGDVELYLTIGQITLYLVMSLRLIRQHDRRIRQTFSDIDKINLVWLSRLLFGIFIVYFIWLIEELISQNFIWDVMLGGSMVILIYCMGYLGLRQPLIFSRPGATDETTENEVESVLQLPAERSEVEEQKYKNSPISTELGEALFQELENHMSDRKPFLDSDISLPRLAEQLDMSLNYLSQVINQQAGKNFFDFINSYRIAEATTLLAEDAENQQNILNLAMSVGFNSKSAFYNAFKKHTGMTPTQYRAQLKIKETAA